MKEPNALPAWMALLSSPGMTGRAAGRTTEAATGFDALMRDVFSGPDTPFGAVDTPPPVSDAVDEEDPLGFQDWSLPGNVVPLRPESRDVGAETFGRSDAADPFRLLSGPAPAPPRAGSAVADAVLAGPSAPPVSSVAMAPAQAFAAPHHEAVPNRPVGGAPASEPIALGAQDVAGTASFPVSLAPPVSGSRPDLEWRPQPAAVANTAPSVPPLPVEPMRGVDAGPLALSSAPVAPPPAVPRRSVGPAATPPLPAQAMADVAASPPPRPHGAVPAPSDSAPSPSLVVPAPLEDVGRPATSTAATSSAPVPTSAYVASAAAGSTSPAGAPLPPASTPLPPAPVMPADAPTIEAVGEPEAHAVDPIEEDDMARDTSAEEETSDPSPSFRIVARIRPEGHYGAHRSGHHTSEVSIPPPSGAYEAPVDAAPELIDLGALHREAVTSLSEGEVTVRVDDEVSVDVAVDGEGVHVVVEASEAAASDLEGLGAELSEQLSQGGQELASFEQRAHGDDAERRPGRGVRGEGGAVQGSEEAEVAPIARGRLVNRIA